MRLLNVSTRQFEEFVDKKLPIYAILSHRWIDGQEVSYQDLLAGESGLSARSGYQKISATCERALEDGIFYVWVDTCCIDKSSSAELSEAINSMYRWYQRAVVCYAYLSDVPVATAFSNDEANFSNSLWFTRGWTLQELIAPENLTFYSAEWKSLGTKTSLSVKVRSITGIDIDVLDGTSNVRNCSVARIMQMASSRITSRPEDIAYCLMGLFDVNMPMLYGEGEKAFIRLQEEILKRSDDHTIFAWTDASEQGNSQHGMLAKSPALFKHSGDFVPYHPNSIESSLITLTNTGLSLRVNILGRQERFFKATLNCARFGHGDLLAYIYMECLDGALSQYCRVGVGELGTTWESGLSQLIYVRQSPAEWAPRRLLKRSLHLVAPHESDGWRDASPRYVSEADRQELVVSRQRQVGLYDFGFKVSSHPNRTIVGFRLEKPETLTLFDHYVIFGTTESRSIGVLVQPVGTKQLPVVARFIKLPVLLSIHPSAYLFVSCATVDMEEEQRFNVQIRLLGHEDASKIPFAEGGWLKARQENERKQHSP